MQKGYCYDMKKLFYGKVFCNVSPLDKPRSLNNRVLSPIHQPLDRTRERNYREITMDNYNKNRWNASLR